MKKIILVSILLFSMLITNAQEKNNKNLINLATLSFSFNQINENPSYFGGTLCNVTFLWVEQNTSSLYIEYYPDRGGKTISKTVTYSGEEVSKSGGMLMYKINRLPIFDVDLGFGLVKETNFTVEEFIKETEYYFFGPYRTTSFARLIEVTNTKVKPTLNCLVGLDVISLFNKGTKRVLIIQPNVLLSTNMKPVFGLNIGVRVKNPYK